MAVVNVHEYRSLCAMPFEELATMTSQLSALDKKDNFNKSKPHPNLKFKYFF